MLKKGRFLQMWRRVGFAASFVGFGLAHAASGSEPVPAPASDSIPGGMKQPLKIEDNRYVLYSERLEPGEVAAKLAYQVKAELSAPGASDVFFPRMGRIVYKQMDLEKRIQEIRCLPETPQTESLETALCLQLNPEGDHLEFGTRAEKETDSRFYAFTLYLMHPGNHFDPFTTQRVVIESRITVRRILTARVESAIHTALRHLGATPLSLILEKKLREEVR